MKYELMVIVNPNAELETVRSRIEKSIKSADASQVKVTKMGRKLLAYAIAKQTEGEYLLFNFEAPQTAVAAVYQQLKLEQEEILRYLIIKSKTGNGTGVIIESQKTESIVAPVVTVKTVKRKKTDKIKPETKLKKVKRILKKATKGKKSKKYVMA